MNRRDKYILASLLGGLLTHAFIVLGCVWWWEIYKLNVNWDLHTGRPVPSVLYVVYAHSWFWVDLIISVVVFSSYTSLLILAVVIAKALGAPKGRFVVGVTLYTVLLLSNWIWYEVFRANIRGVDRVYPGPDTVFHLLWGDAMYVITTLLSFAATATFLVRSAKVCEAENKRGIGVVLGLYTATHAVGFVWMYLVARVSGERFFGWYFPSPFYLWSIPIYAWCIKAYSLTIVAVTVIACIAVYEYVKRRESMKKLLVSVDYHGSGAVPWVGADG